MGKKNQNADLGRALNRRRAKEQRDASANHKEHGSGAGNHPEAAQLQSVLDASDLTELMQNVTLANTVYGGPGIATPLAPQVVVLAPKGKARPNAAAKRAREHDANDLRIPRRPAWNANTTPNQLDEDETSAFLTWRRKIAEVEESLAIEAGFGGTMLTPFEKNIHVWRQLWRVVERADVVMQIVDARNPLLYYCPDLYRYVAKEMHRSHVLLVNKADLLSSSMISRWERYFEEQGIDALFFSAFKASVNEETHDPRVMSTDELIRKLHSFSHTSPIIKADQRLTIGMVGYPNVGKSSTINILLEVAAAAAEQERATTGEENGEVASPNDHEPEGSDGVGGGGNLASNLASKRVAVSATPGKTKHFQTLVLSDRVLLCDCPGLVFPNFSASKAELICAGILSIDQMRGDPIPPVSLVAGRIPASIFEGVYGIRFEHNGPGLLEEESPARPGYVTAETLLETHARARGFMSDHNKADKSRSARVLLKEFVSGRILFAHAPPPRGEDDGESGIGPDVFARKGKLVYARAQAAEEAAQEEALHHAGRELATESVSEDVVESVASASGSAAAVMTGVPLSTKQKGRIEGPCEPVARISRGKKIPSRAFTRIERNYYPQVD
jgi:large subunit GTPase 1